MRKYSSFILFLFLTFSCNTIDEDMLTPAWILEKIEIMENDCYYKGSTIKKYSMDSVYYIDMYMPNHLWPIENVYYEDGTPVVTQEDTAFSYYYFKANRGDKIKDIWTFPDDLGCE